MLSELLPIYRDTYILCQALFQGINNVPKFLRYGEYGKAISLAMEALDLIYIANSKIEGRNNVLRKYLITIGGVRSRIRLFGDLKYLTIKKQTYLMKLIDKIVKQAIGWRNCSI